MVELPPAVASASRSSHRSSAARALAGDNAATRLLLKPYLSRRPVAEFELGENDSLRLKQFAHKSLGIEGSQDETREAALQVQPVTPLVRESRRIRLEAGATQALDKTLLDAFWAGSASVSLSVSNTPPIDIKDQVQGLLMYPYGCLEQKIGRAHV